MPDLFVQASRYRVSKMRATYAAKATLDEYEADRGLSVRQRLEDRGEKRTEKDIKSRVIKDKEYKRLRREVHRAEAREEFSKLVLEAFRMRRDAIRIIADHQHWEGGRQAAEVERIEQRKRLINEARELTNRRERLR